MISQCLTNSIGIALIVLPLSQSVELPLQARKNRLEISGVMCSMIQVKACRFVLDRRRRLSPGLPARLKSIAQGMYLDAPDLAAIPQFYSLGQSERHVILAGQHYSAPSHGGRGCQQD
jgi:hypothetical protein